MSSSIPSWSNTARTSGSIKIRRSVSRSSALLVIAANSASLNPQWMMISVTPVGRFRKVSRYLALRSSNDPC